MKRPDLTVTLVLEDETEKTIKLTYGLFNDLQRIISDPAELIEVFATDPSTRDYIIRRCMTDIRKMIKDPDKELIQVEDCGLDDPDEIEKLLNWVAGHMLYFFATSAGGLKRLGEAFKETMTPDVVLPAPSTTGSPS